MAVVIKAAQSAQGSYSYSDSSKIWSTIDQKHSVVANSNEQYRAVHKVLQYTVYNR